MVYPGEMDISVNIVPKAEGFCSTVTETATDCTMLITKDDIYTVHLTLSNDVGSTRPVMQIFDCKCLCSTISIHMHVVLFPMYSVQS